MKTLNLVLAIVAALTIAFTVCMIVIFCRHNMTPDTLITCWFAAVAGECGICGWIKTAKVRAQERQWQLEDEKRLEEKQHGKAD